MRYVVALPLQQRSGLCIEQNTDGKWAVPKYLSNHDHNGKINQVTA